VDLDDTGIKEVTVGVARIHPVVFGIDDGDRQIALPHRGVEAQLDGLRRLVDHRVLVGRRLHQDGVAPDPESGQKKK